MAMATAPKTNNNPTVLTKPTVLSGFLKSWSCSSWDVRGLSRILGNRKVCFRIGLKDRKIPNVQFEGECQYVEATLADFAEWCGKGSIQDEQSDRSEVQTTPDSTPPPLQQIPVLPLPLHSSSIKTSSSAAAEGHTLSKLLPSQSSSTSPSMTNDVIQAPASDLQLSSGPSAAAGLVRDARASRKHREGTEPPPITPGDSGNPLAAYDRMTHWCYADYKHMLELFDGCSQLLKEVCWSDLGFPDRDGRHSTIWIGSEGANTPCHQDSYGFNLVAQIAGRKRWHLFPPCQTDLMYPTRVPYEESSVFSRVNVKHPDLSRHPHFSLATPHVVTLHPGDILFVPKHWWHDVESLDVSISINCWMDLESDRLSRVDEAITRTIVCGLMGSEEQLDDDDDDDDGEDERKEAEDEKKMEEEGGSNSHQHTVKADRIRKAMMWLNPTEEMTGSRINVGYLKSALQAAMSNERGSLELRHDESEINTERRSEWTYLPAWVPVNSAIADAEPSRNTCQGMRCDTVLQRWRRVGSHNQDEQREMADQAICGKQKSSTPSGEKCLPEGQTTFPSGVCSVTDPCNRGSKQNHGIQGEVRFWGQKLKRGSCYMAQEGSASEPNKRVKLPATVTIPGSRIPIPTQRAAVIECRGAVGELTVSRGANDSSNLKMELESEAPLGATLESGEPFVDVTMATLVECLTHPKIITSVRQLLAERVCGKGHGVTREGNV